MNDFSLSRKREKLLPESLTDESGKVWAIDPDYRTVLRCLRVLTDPDISQRDKTYLLLRWFFKGALVPGAMTLFVDFARSIGEPEDSGEAKMDFEADADVIYAGFLQCYGLDLLDVPFLHWRRFVALLGGLGAETALGRRIELRGMDTRKMSQEDRAKWEKAKAAVRIAPKIGAEEAALQAELDRRIMAGEDVTDILARLKEVT